MSQVKLQFKVITEWPEALDFFSELLNLAKDADVSLYNMHMVAGVSEVKFTCLPEHLTDEISELINHAAHMFRAEVTEPKEV